MIQRPARRPMLSGAIVGYPLRADTKCKDSIVFCHAEMQQLLHFSTCLKPSEVMLANGGDVVQLRSDPFFELKAFVHITPRRPIRIPVEYVVATRGWTVVPFGATLLDGCDA